MTRLRMLWAAVCMSFLLSVLMFNGCGSGSPPIAVTIAAPSSTTVNAGSAAVTLTATVTNDSKTGGVTWALSPSTCGTLSSSGTTATYTPPTEAALSANCTATITATSVTNTAKSGSVTMTVKAVAITLPTGESATQAATAGGSGTTLTVAIANDTSGAATLSWSIARSSVITSHPNRTVSPNILDTCGKLSATTGTSVTYTPPAAEACTAVITVTNSANTSVTQTFTIVVSLPPVLVTITSPTTAQTMVTGQSALTIAASITNDVLSEGLSWSTDNSSCGTLSATTGASITFTPVTTLTAACVANVKAASVEDPTKLATLAITVNPITVSIATPTSAPTIVASSTQAITATTNDPAGASTLTWTVSTGCGSLTGTTGTSNTFTAPTSITASCTATVTVTSSTDSTKKTTLVITVNPITVSIATPTSAPTIVAGSTQAITATTNDPAGASTLTWTVSTGCGSLTGTTGASNTFTAPTSITASCTATVTVTSSTDSTKKTTLVITVDPITVSIATPTSAPTIVAGSTQAITATTNDPAGASTLTWTVSTGCGSLTGTTGASNTFTAPTSITASCTATVTVTSSTDSTKKTTLVITVDPITVSITSPTSNPTVLSGASATNITASTNDPAGASTLLWTLNTTTCGSLTATTGASTSFAPPAMLASACTATVTVKSATDSTKSATLTFTVNPAPIVVTITSPTTSSVSVGESGTLTVTATIYNDANSSGISNVLAGSCGGFSGMTKQSTSGATATYTGTFTAPASACTATLTLSSVADNTKTAALTLNVVQGIVVSLAPSGPAGVDANNTLSITPTVTNDSAGLGVNLSLNVTTCGSLSATSASSGSAVTFTPVSSLASNCSVTLTATSISNSARTATLAITVYPALTLPSASSITSLGSATTGALYNGYINASGGPGGTYTWTVTGLSDSLTSNAATNTGNTLTILGTPTTAGTVTAHVSVQDSTGFSVGPVTYSIAVNQYVAVSLPATTLTDAIQNQSYNATINATGGVQTYTFTVNGTTIGSSNTTISSGGGLYANNSGGNTLIFGGTPSTLGTITLNVGVTDGESHTASKSYTVNVVTATPLVINTTQSDIPQGMATMPYSLHINVSGGVPPYTYTYPTATFLVDGLTGDQNGNITGTPFAGSVNFYFSVADSASQTTGTYFTMYFVPVTATTHNSLLTGQYACYMDESRDSAYSVNGYDLYHHGSVFAFAANGSGTITGGEADTNGPNKGYKSAAQNGTLTGTYAVGADNRGYINLNSMSPLLSVAGGVTNSSGYFTELDIAEMGDAGSSPSGKHGGGRCFKQVTTTALTGQYLSGGFVFGLNGEDYTGMPAVLVGSFQSDGAGNITNGVQDMAEGLTLTSDFTFTGTVTAADSFGRVVMTSCPTGQSCGGGAVFYITNQSKGQAVVMNVTPHSAGDMFVGQTRKQVATHVAATYPFNGPMVVYASGSELSSSSSSPVYKATAAQLTGSSNAKTLTFNASVGNNAGTVKLNTDPAPGTAMSYTVDSTTGRMFVSSTVGGDAFYVYDTNSAVVLFADGSSSSSVINMLGWVDPQMDPTANSGVWSASELASSYIMGQLDNGNTSGDFQSGVLSIDSTGSFSNMAQDSGGNNWADWDEGLSGSSGTTATAAAVQDTTLDSAGTLGVFDINMKEGTSTKTQVICFAVSVDQATNSATKGRLVCVDADSHDSPKVTTIQE